MIWNADTPPDSDPANEIHLRIHDAKEMMRERFTGFDGTIHAHQEANSVDSGKHELSLVGFCRIHANYSALEAFTPKVKGSLHAVLSPRGLYTIDSNLDIVTLYPPSHSGLSDLLDDDHTQYQLTSLARPMEGDIELADLTISNPGTLDHENLPEDHMLDDWTGGHGAGTLGSRHFATDSVKARHLILEVVSGAGFIDMGATTGQYSLPWIMNATSAHAGDVFWTFMVRFTNNMGFRHSVHGWIDADVYAGRFS